MQLSNDKEKKLWRKVQVSKCIGVLLIFAGIIMMQMVAYILCTLGYAGYLWTEGVRMPELLNQLSRYMSGSSSMLMWVSAVSATLCLVWCGILYRRSDWREERKAYGQVFSFRNVLSIFCVGAGACIVLTVFLSLLVLVFPEAFSDYQKLMSNIEYDSSMITVPYVLLIGPASEEMIFRGAMMDRLRIAFPFWLANLLQAALFGVYHMNLIQGLYAFCLGVVLGVIVKVTGSILSSMLTHCIFNTTSYVLGYIFQEEGNSTALLFVLLVGIVALVGGLQYFIRKEKEQSLVEKGMEKVDL